jgi:nucleoside-diphosphate-sugar epimerase
MISQALSGRVKLTHAKTKFDLVYSKDIARAVLLALEKTKGFEIFNVSSGKPISLISLAKKIISLCNKKAQIKVISNDDQHNPIISSKKISSLGWKASSFDDSLKSVVEFYSKKN